jgi:hypothetical protein
VRLCVGEKIFVYDVVDKRLLCLPFNTEVVDGGELSFVWGCAVAGLRGRKGTKGKGRGRGRGAEKGMGKQGEEKGR